MGCVRRVIVSQWRPEVRFSDPDRVAGARHGHRLGIRRRGARASPPGVARQAEGTPEDVVVAPAPRLVKFSKGFFPVFLIVLVLRSFIVEPFRIPSNSMMPTLLTGTSSSSTSSTTASGCR